MDCPICGYTTTTVSQRRVIRLHGMRRVRVYHEDEAVCKNCGWKESDGVPEDLDVESEDSSDGRAASGANAQVH